MHNARHVRRASRDSICCTARANASTTGNDDNSLMMFIEGQFADLRRRKCTVKRAVKINSVSYRNIINTG